MDQLTYTDAVMKETLRMYPSASIGNRECAQDQIIGGEQLALRAGVPSSGTLRPSRQLKQMLA